MAANIANANLQFTVSTHARNQHMMVQLIKTVLLLMEKCNLIKSFSRALGKQVEDLNNK